LTKGPSTRSQPPGFDEVEREEAQDKYSSSTTREQLDEVARVEEAPLHIRESLQRFRADYPDPATVAFILMPFGKTKAYEQIGQAIKNGLAAHGITGIRADDKEYHEDLFPNVLTYMHGCGMGVAVFERIEKENFNPNVSLEVGYMYAMRKPLCLLKDQRLTQLHADLMGKLYREFDTYAPGDTIPSQITQWLNDRALSRRQASNVSAQRLLDLRHLLGAEPGGESQNVCMVGVGSVADHSKEPSLEDFLLERLYTFVGEGWEQEDDITLLTLRRSGPRI
jgi:nucleoside 2-deoxyribosyltransferase